MTIVAPSRLQLHSDFAVSGDGLLSGGSSGAALLRSLDARFRRLALDAGAKEHQYPTLISEKTLYRAEYFQSFPDYASRVDGGKRTERYFLSPAVCYHSYESLADSQLASENTLTCCGKCFRGDAIDRFHLWEFTMREIVFAGGAAWVQEQRQSWMQRTHQWALELGLAAELVPANDPFFGVESRGKQLLQQVKQLKFELQVHANGRSAAIASFNLHEQFFAKRFGITLKNNAPAYSGCVAFGIERWALALDSQYGAGEALKRIEANP